MGRKVKDLKGKIFGKLTVLERDLLTKRTDRRAFWKCKCDCGQFTIVSSQLLGKIKSCGCSQNAFEDISGTKINMLSIIERSGKGWKCVCDCGKETIQEITHIKRGIVKSCGCYNKSKIRFIDGSSNKNKVLKSYKDGAVKRQLEWKLTDDQFFKLVEGACYYCGTLGGNSLSKRDSRAPAYNYTGVDRTVNNDGYNLINCVSCCHICNHAKSNLLYDDFLKWIDTIIKFRT